MFDIAVHPCKNGLNTFRTKLSCTAGVWVFPAGNLQTPQEILTKTLIIERIL